MIQTCQNKTRDLHIVFVDLEKGFNQVLRKVLQKTMEEKGVRDANFQVKDMHTNIRTVGGKTKDDFPKWNQV